jgi:hypothetical protein
MVDIAAMSDREMIVGKTGGALANHGTQLTGAEDNRHRPR